MLPSPGPRYCRAGTTEQQFKMRFTKYENIFKV